MRGDRILGVLGGMGPLATVEFLRKLIEHTPAEIDQDHIPCISYSIPQIPCRVAAILEHGPSPLPALIEGIKTLEAAGVRAIAIPCVTAHHWFEQMAASTRLPFLHIAEATIKVLAADDKAGGRVGILATQATLTAGHFQRALSDAGYRSLTPDEVVMQELVLPAIAKVKIGKKQEAFQLTRKALAALRAQGAERVVLACTELPIALDGAEPQFNEGCIDTVDALARECVDWASRQ